MSNKERLEKQQVLLDNTRSKIATLQEALTVEYIEDDEKQKIEKGIEVYNKQIESINVMIAKIQKAIEIESI